MPSTPPAVAIASALRTGRAVRFDAPTSNAAIANGSATGSAGK